MPAGSDGILAAVLSARIQTLIQESNDLESRASRVQGSSELLASSSEIAALEHDYLEWFARALDALPESFHERFRDAYEGGFFTSKIKAFLQGPADPNPLYEPDNTLLAEFWANPFERVFKPPLMDQRQILAEAKQRLEGTGSQSEHVVLLERMCRNFGAYVQPLRKRGRDGPVFSIEDEYDVQTLLDAALRLLFDDVRAEDYVPEYAGGKSRVDFLLKAEGIVVETKMTRESLKDRALGEELLIDIARYQSHPSCSLLVVLIYDPGRLLTNPRGLESDLSRKHDGLPVFVYVTN